MGDAFDLTDLSKAWDEVESIRDGLRKGNSLLKVSKTGCDSSIQECKQNFEVLTPLLHRFFACRLKLPEIRPLRVEIEDTYTKANRDVADDQTDDDAWDLRTMLRFIKRKDHDFQDMVLILRPELEAQVLEIRGKEEKQSMESVEDTDEDGSDSEAEPAPLENVEPAPLPSSGSQPVVPTGSKGDHSCAPPTATEPTPGPAPAADPPAKPSVAPATEPSAEAKVDKETRAGQKAFARKVLLEKLEKMKEQLAEIQAKKVAPKAGRGDHVAKDLGPDFDKAVKIPGKGDKSSPSSLPTIATDNVDTQPVDVMELPVPAATPSKPVSSDDVTRKRRKYQNLETDSSKLGTTLVLGDGNKNSPESSESTHTPSSTSAKKSITTTSGGSPADEVTPDANDSAIPKPRRRRVTKSKVPPPVPEGWWDDNCEDDPEPAESEPCEVADADDPAASKAVTRRDQLSLKRPPQSARGKGRGKGRSKGRGRGKGVSGSKPKGPKRTVTKSKAVKKKHDVEDEEVSDIDMEENYDDGKDEDGSEMNEHAPPPRRRAGKAKGKTKNVKNKKHQKKAAPKAKVDKAATPCKDASNPKKSKKAPSTMNQPAVPKKSKASKACGLYVIRNDTPIPEQMMQFTQMIDTALDLDSFKEAVRATTGNLGRGSLNAYWSKNTCGLKWQFGRDSRDITTFAFHRGCPGEPRVKLLIAVAAAIHLAHMMTEKLPNLSEAMISEMAEDLRVHGRHALIRLANDVD